MSQVTARRQIEQIALDVQTKDFKGNKWGDRHYRAWIAPRTPHEWAVKHYIVGLAEYIDGHADMAWTLGDDGYCGVYWLEIAKATVSLLSGPMGERFDGGTLDHQLRVLAELAGFDPDDL